MRHAIILHFSTFPLPVFLTLKLHYADLMLTTIPSNTDHEAGINSSRLLDSAYDWAHRIWQVSVCAGEHKGE